MAGYAKMKKLERFHTHLATWHQKAKTARNFLLLFGEEEEETTEKVNNKDLIGYLICVGHDPSREKTD